jgi:hypothetical protein
MVLAGAAAFEAYSWRISYRELCRSKDPNETIFDEIIGSKDPTIFTVFLEDSAGLIGTVLAFLGILFARALSNPYMDSTASILIGVLRGGPGYECVQPSHSNSPTATWHCGPPPFSTMCPE